MKKYTKEIVLVLITAILVSVISVSATVYFNSENITFEPDDTNWNVSSTSSALNDLYSYANSGDATASNILLGKTALVNGTLITGTMTDNGAINTTINPGESYSIPAGYHNGSGTITASSLASQLKSQTKSVQVTTSAFANGYFYSCSGTITFDFPNRVVGAVNPYGHSGYGGITSISGNTVKFGYSGFGRGDNKPNTPWSETITITAEGY